VPAGHGSDLRRFVVAVWLLVRDERALNVDRARLRLEGDLQLQAVEQRPELWLGQVLKPLGEKRQPVERSGEDYDSRRDVGRLGGEGVRVLPPFSGASSPAIRAPTRRRGDGVASSASRFATWRSMRCSRSMVSP